MAPTIVFTTVFRVLSSLFCLVSFKIFPCLPERAFVVLSVVRLSTTFNWISLSLTIIPSFLDTIEVLPELSTVNPLPIIILPNIVFDAILEISVNKFCAVPV